MTCLTCLSLFPGVLTTGAGVVNRENKRLFHMATQRGCEAWERGLRPAGRHAFQAPRLVHTQQGVVTHQGALGFKDVRTLGPCSSTSRSLPEVIMGIKRRLLERVFASICEQKARVQACARGRGSLSPEVRAPSLTMGCGIRTRPVAQPARLQGHRRSEGCSSPGE